MNERKETGAQELRRVTSALSCHKESALDPYTAEELLRIMRAIAASGWDVFIDQLTREERNYAAKHGRLSKACCNRIGGGP